MEKLENIFSGGKKKEQFTPILELWAKKDGTRLSPIALQDFGKFLMGRLEYRNGDMACLQMRHEVPLEVIFFSKNPNFKDSVYKIKHNHEKNIFEVTKTKNQEDKLTPLLEWFGLTKNP